MGNARLAALTALSTWRRGGDFTQDALKAAIERNGLDVRDGALATALCHGAIQRLYFLDYYIGLYSTMPLGRFQPKALDVLRISAYQILFMDKIPDSAAVSEGVSLCKSLGMAKASGIVNAVLRRISENKAALPAIEGDDPLEIMSTYYSVPLWLTKYVISRVGTGQAQEFFRSCNTVPALNIQVNATKGDRESLLKILEENGIDARPHEYLPDCIVTNASAGAVMKLGAFGEGLFYVQDPASFLSCIASAPEAGHSILDCCSAPGGKSFALSMLTGGKAKIIACDISDKKLRLVSGGAERLGLRNIEVQKRDAREFAPGWKDAFDLVIADVPCSGFGVISKKPEIRYKNPDSVVPLPEIQREILVNVSRYVKPGGALMYSTCTILSQENEEVVSAFLSENPGFEAEDFVLPGGIKSFGGMLTLWPQINGTDGFFVARLRRKA